MIKPAALEFFAGSGLVSEALRPYFEVAWANDNCSRKAAIYTANHGSGQFQLGSIDDVKGINLPAAVLAWASFPCQDLSLAGSIDGIHGARSGLFWQWLRVLDEMPQRPQVLVAENVLGLVSARDGVHYRAVHRALVERGYRVGTILLDAIRWVPQSRPRVFIIAVREGAAIPPELRDDGPNWLHHPAIVRAGRGPGSTAELAGWLWWKLPEPPSRRTTLDDMIEWDAELHADDVSRRNIALVPPRHRARFGALKDADAAAPGYKRMRQGMQVLELRFDGVAGCLRTARGGSSRQFLVFRRNGGLRTRLLTVRETARLMGAPAAYRIPGSYNDGYNAMGDAVVVPVAQYLAQHLLVPLTTTIRQHG